MKKLYAVILMMVCVLSLLFIGCKPKEEKKVYEEELPTSFVNKQLGFELTKEVKLPEAKTSSTRGTQIEKLVTLYGKSYENDEYLKEDVILFRQWQWEELYKSLDKKAKDNPKWLNTFRLQAEVYLTNSKYNEALYALDRVLAVNPDDVYALGLSSYIQHILGNTEQKTARLNALGNVSAKCRNDVIDLISFVSSEIVKPHGKGLEDTSNLSYDSIGVLGVSPTPTGEISAGGVLRLKEVVKAAYLISKGNPDKNPKIIISGGAIDTNYSEAEVMKNYLVRNANAMAVSLEIGEIDKNWTIYGDQVILDTMARDTVGNAIGILKEVSTLKLKNLLIVGSKDQVMRADCIFQSYAKANNLNVKITSAQCSSSDPSGNQEKYAYVCSAVAYGLFTKEDFSRHTEITVCQDPDMSFIKGKVVSDKESYKTGEVASISVVSGAGYVVDQITAKTSSGKEVAIKDGKITVGTEDVFVNATFKDEPNTVNVSFFHPQYFGTSNNGDTTITSALKKAEEAIRELTANIESVSDNIHIESSDPNNALGYGKMGGFGLAAGGRVGGFKVNFFENFKVKKVVVTVVKFTESEGKIQINGIDPTKGTLQGEANIFDCEYTVEFEFDTPTNVIDLKTVSENGNFGRVIIYGMTFYLAEDVKEYNITVNESNNGSIFVPEKAVEGALVNMVVEGKPGYFIENLKVKKGDIEIEVTDNSFIMPDGDVIIEGEFVSRLSYETNVVLDGSKVYNDDMTIVGSISLDKEAYAVDEKAKITLGIGHGFELLKLEVKTKSGTILSLSDDLEFTFTTEDVVITATFKMISKTFTISFFNREIYEKGGNGTTNVGNALKEATDDILAVNNNFVSVTGDNMPTGADERNALGYGKAGGFGMAAGGRVGWFTLTFKEEYKISKVVVNVVRNSETEGLLRVNGNDLTNTYNNGQLQGAPQQYDYNNLAEYVFENPTNVLVFATYPTTIGEKTNYGRVIVYSITVYLSE